jgi:hypothetical protein
MITIQPSAISMAQTRKPYFKQQAANMNKAAAYAA